MQVTRMFTGRAVSRLMGLFLLALVAGCGSTPKPGPDRPRPAPTRPLPPLDLNAPSSAHVQQQLYALRANPAQCQTLLRQAEGLTVEPLKDWQDAPRCIVTNTSRMLDALALPDRKVPLTCPMIAGYHLWLRESVLPLARKYFGQNVKTVETFGSYACRNRNGQSNAPISEHASANALDVSGFLLADGRRIRIHRDWNSGDSATRTFLRDVHRSACRYFSIVLGPEADAFHKDHFHLDMGHWRKCQ